MESIRIQISQELFAQAESSHFEGKIDVSELEVGPDLYTFAHPAAWKIDVTNTGDAFLVTGSVEGEAVTACARCLEDVTLPLVGEIEGYFLIGEDAPDPEDMDEDEFERLPEDETIDVSALVTAALLLEVPLVPLCDEGCKGLCANCGANLNEGPCDCAKAEPDFDFELAKNPFAALKDYDFGEAEK